MKRLLRFRPDWTPRLLDLLGFGLIVGGVLVLLGPGPAMLTAGAIFVMVGYALE